jgi:hypothetical protein
MPATEEQWDEIQALKATHAQELAAFDRQCSDARFELVQGHDQAFNDLYRQMGARRVMTNHNQSKGEENGKST